MVDQLKNNATTLFPSGAFPLPLAIFVEPQRKKGKLVKVVDFL